MFDPAKTLKISHGHKNSVKLHGILKKPQHSLYSLELLSKIITTKYKNTVTHCLDKFKNNIKECKMLAVSRLVNIVTNNERKKIKSTFCKWKKQNYDNRLEI